MMLFALIQKIVLYDDKVEIYYNYIKNPYPDNFSPEIDRDFSFIACSIVFQSVAPQNPEFSLRNRGFVFFRRGVLLKRPSFLASFYIYLYGRARNYIFLN